MRASVALISAVLFSATCAATRERVAPPRDQKPAVAVTSIDEPVQSVPRRPPHHQFVTKAPESEEVGYRTGKLNQFAGFVTPAPLPLNAMFLYSSVWAAWSAWSFCVNDVRIRVRACNTIRGFSCYGSNREEKRCDEQSDSLSTFAPQQQQQQQVIQQIQPPAPRPISSGGIDSEYEANDPYNEDRELALKQLYGDYDATIAAVPSTKIASRPPAPSFTVPIVTSTEFPDHDDFTDFSSPTTKQQELQQSIGGTNSAVENVPNKNLIGQIDSSEIRNGNEQFPTLRPGGNNGVGGVPIQVQPPIPSSPGVELDPERNAPAPPAPINTPAKSSEEGCQQTPLYPYWICVTNVLQPRNSPFNQPQLQPSVVPARIPVSPLVPAAPEVPEAPEIPANSPVAPAVPARFSVPPTVSSSHPPAPPANQPPGEHPEQAAIFDANTRKIEVGGVPIGEHHMVHIDGKTYEIIVPPAHQEEKSDAHESSAIIAKKVEAANPIPPKTRSEGFAGRPDASTQLPQVDVIYETGQDESETTISDAEFEEPVELRLLVPSDAPKIEAANSNRNSENFHQLRPAIAVNVGGPQSQFGQELVRNPNFSLVTPTAQNVQQEPRIVKIKQPLTQPPPNPQEEGFDLPDSNPLYVTSADGSFQLFTEPLSEVEEEYIDELEESELHETTRPTDDIQLFTAPPPKPDDEDFDNPSKAPKAYASLNTESDDKVNLPTFSPSKPNEKGSDSSSKAPQLFSHTSFEDEDKAVSLKQVQIVNLPTQKPPMPNEKGFDSPKGAPKAVPIATFQEFSEDEEENSEGLRDAPRPISKDDTVYPDEEQYSFGEGLKSASSALHEPKTSAVEFATTLKAGNSASAVVEQVVDNAGTNQSAIEPEQSLPTTVGIQPSQPVNQPSIIVPELPQSFNGSGAPLISEDNLSIDQSPSSVDEQLASTIDRHADFAKWSKWAEWGSCFCGQRARTRSCDYDSPYLTKGCVGKSYETKPCTGGVPCPDSGRHYIEASTTQRPAPTYYTLAPQPRGGREPPKVGYALQLHPLSNAWLSRDDSSHTGDDEQRRR